MNSLAGDCSVSGANVTRVFQHKDGFMFVVFDKATDCACSIPTRLAYSKSSDEKFFTSAALTALTASRKVFARGDDTGCPFHGNTAKLTDFHIYK